MNVDFKKIPLFAGVDDEALRALAGRTATESVPAGRVIFKEGDPPDALYLVLTGKVRVFLEGVNGKELALSTKGPGDYFGEMMLDERPRSATVATLEPSQFAVLSREVFSGFVAEHPRVALQIIRDLIRVGRGMNERTRETFRQHIEGLEQLKVHELAAARRWRAAKSLLVAAAVIFVGLQVYYYLAG